METAAAPRDLGAVDNFDELTVRKTHRLLERHHIHNHARLGQAGRALSRLFRNAQFRAHGKS
jgi:hypothetical protein